MKYFLDTEFIEDGRTIELVSIGVVAEDGRTFYAESCDFDESKASAWVRDNVLSKLGPKDDRIPRRLIADRLLAFTTFDGQSPEFWAAWGAYDWVAVCQLYGPMIAKPERFPFFVRDVIQLWHECGKPTLPPEPSNEHNALADAVWTKDAYECIVSSLGPTWRALREKKVLTEPARS